MMCPPAISFQKFEMKSRGGLFYFLTEYNDEIYEYIKIC